MENARWNGLHIQEPTFYFTYEHFVDWGGFFAFDSTVIIRTVTDPLELTIPIRNLIREKDPCLPIRSMRTIDEIASSSVADPRFMMALMALFAGIALLLGIIGIYGVISYNVARRANEFGIRMTLGARMEEIAGIVVKQALALTLFGILIGLAASLAASQLISSFLFETSPTDPTTYVIVTLFVITVTLLASLLPALRASRVDPVHSLRIE